MVTAREVKRFVDERPEFESAVEAVLEADEPFSFADLGIDSGAFGELVAAGLVEQREDGYHVANRHAVERGLAGDIEPAPEADESLTAGLPSVDRRAALALVSVLTFVLLLRTVFSFGSVFQAESVVLSGNDPYYYRYWVERILGNPEVTLSSLPAAVTRGEPLYIATMWAATALVGGTPTAAGWVLAWFPVVSALCSGVLVYLLTVAVTDDRRVGLAAVSMLGLVAGHALRTSLGFADHHAFDYPWLGVTALGLVLLVTQDGWSKRTALGIAGLTGGVAGQVLAWEAGPLLIVPVGLIVAGLAVGWVRAGESPLVQGLPIVGGLSGAAAIVWAVHTGLGWHTTVVASAPVLLTAGAGGVLLVTEAIFRTRPDARLAGGAVLASGLVGLPTIAIVQPAAWATLTARVSGTLIRTDAIAETDGLFADSAGWLLLFGFVLVLALPYLGWATRRALDDLRWVVPVGYAWAFLSLAVLQVRFVGEFATFAAVFAGLGFVHLAERVDLARPPQPFSGAVDGHMLTLPDRQQAGSIVLLFLLVGGLGLIQVPIKTNQVTTPAPMYETAAWMDDYTERSEWGDRPEYVLSQWGDNRMYNYHVSGNSRSYRFARQNYPVFLGAVDAQTWYERLSGRTGFIVYAGTSGPERTVAARLAAFGSRTSAVSGLAHYRAVYDSPDGPYRVFTLVPGATLVGTAEPNTTVTVATTTTVAGSDRTVEYERRVATDAEGQYRVTVPYPGEYTSPTGTTAVSERAVLSGTTVSINGTTG